MKTHLLSLVVWAGLTVSASATDRPNVLFLFTDDQRADTIAALGNRVIETPHLDSLVEGGFVFRNAYCMGSTKGAVCNPSRHMVFTGRSLFRYDEQQKEGTFADVFRKAGYETWHLSKRGNVARVAHTAFEHSDYLNDAQERNSGHHGRTEAREAVGFLENGWDRQRPFFLYLGFAGPHDPRVAAAEWMDRYERSRIPVPANFQPFHPFNNGDLFVRDEKLAPWPRTEAIVREHLHDYYGCITSIDASIGRILETLKRLGQFEKTLIIFSSDHGLAMGSHGLFGKQNVYEHSMNAPLIFAGPGVEKGSSDAFAYLFDIFPSAVELAGLPVPESVEGKSLAPVIRGEAEAVRESVYLAFKDVQRAVRQGDWKLIRYPLHEVTQLFNLADDPEETVNLADDPAHVEKLSEMNALLRAQHAAYADPFSLHPEKTEPAEVTPADFEDSDARDARPNFDSSGRPQTRRRP